jgi:uncharacterized membrane protein YhaH (DUF805 family)
LRSGRRADLSAAYNDDIFSPNGLCSRFISITRFSDARTRTMPSLPSLAFDPLIALAVVVATACTDAIYVLFTNAVVKRRRFPAAAWSSIWYMLGSFAVINYTQHWIYVVFAAAGSFVGAYVTMTFLHPGPTYPPPPVGSAAA